MSTVFLIPMINTNQTFPITLSGVTYVLTVRWNYVPQYWVMDVATEDGTPIANGVPLITGTDLLTQLKYLEISGQLVVQTTHNTDAVPTFANLGKEGNLYYVTT